MSKIGKKPVQIPEGVETEIQGQEIVAKGPKGELSMRVYPQIKIEKKENQILLKAISNSKMTRSMYGLSRNLINNMIEGVSQGFKKQLELQGLGYRAALSQDDNKQKLVLSIGFSHTVEVLAPEGISFSVVKNIITIEGIDKQLVGETAAKIRALRKPEPYKGKGIRYVGEVVKLKPGKAVIKTGA